MKLQLSYRSIAALLPYARNARTHSEAQVAQIAASIAEFGWTNPILVDGDNGVIAGHGRLLAARKLGLSEVPVIELAHLTPTQRRAYLIADNQLALRAGWDDELLALELLELQQAGFDLNLTGLRVRKSRHCSTSSSTMVTVRVTIASQTLRWPMTSLRPRHQPYRSLATYG